jgi:TFIIF-interacting CTD phosphatase-like protein
MLLSRGEITHMRLLRDEQPVKQRESFSFGISTEGRKVMNVFEQIPKGNSFKEYILYHDQHEPLFTP